MLDSRIRGLLFFLLIGWGGRSISAEAFAHGNNAYYTLVKQQAYPLPTPTIPPAPTNLPTVASDPFYATPTPRADGKIIYIVQAGDTLVGVATRFGYTVEQLNALYSLNGMTRDDFLFVGQELLLGHDQGAVVPLAGNVPPRYAGTTYRDSDHAFIHQVQAGDTLISIALAYGYRTMEAFYEVSGLNTDSLIAVGQAVIVGFKPIPSVTGGSSELPLTIPPPPPTAAPATLRPTRPPLPTATPIEFPTLAATPTERVVTLEEPALNVQNTPAATFALADAPQGQSEPSDGASNWLMLFVAGMGILLIVGALGWFVRFGRK